MSRPLPKDPNAGEVVLRIINGLIVGIRAFEDLVNLVGARARGIDYTPGGPLPRPEPLQGHWCGTHPPVESPRPPALLSDFSGPETQEDDHERPDPAAAAPEPPPAPGS